MLHTIAHLHSTHAGFIVCVSRIIARAGDIKTISSA